MKMKLNTMVANVSMALFLSSGAIMSASAANLVDNGITVNNQTLNIGNKRVTNVADGAIDALSTDAITGGQIHSLLLNIGSVLGTGVSMDNGGLFANEKFGHVDNDEPTTIINHVSIPVNSVSRHVRDARRIAERNQYSFQVGQNTFNTPNDEKVLHEMGNKSDLNFTAGKNISSRISHGATGFNEWHYTCSDSVLTDPSTGGADIISAEQCGDIQYSAAVSYELNDDIHLNSVTANSHVTIPNSVTINANGIQMQNKGITGLKDGNVNQTSTDAINGSQLHNGLNSISNVFGGNATTQDGNVSMTNIGNTGQNTVHDALDYLNRNLNKENMQFVIQDKHGSSDQVKQNSVVEFASATPNLSMKVVPSDGNPQVVVDMNPDLKVNSMHADSNITVGKNGVRIDSNGVDLKGGNINNMATVGNIYDTNNDLKGVNVQTLRNALNDIKVPEPDFTPVYQRIDKLNDDLSGGVAGVAASAALPQVFDYGKNLVAVGVGHFNNKQALAAGFSAITDNGKHIVKLQGSMDLKNGKNNTVGAGYGYSW